MIETTVGSTITNTTVIQPVWSGYGQLLRVSFDKPQQSSLVVKLVVPPAEQQHPRGWQSDVAHQRKLKSYQVEACWYERYALSARDTVAVARAMLVHRESNGTLLVLEDLDDQFPRRLTLPRAQECRVGLEWLARFHARYLGADGDGLWNTGCYWHLQTRPDEWAAMRETPLKMYASAIDEELHDCEMVTLVHGDAKAANFCLSADGLSVAAVDFQYVGHGCGMRDVAYYLGSCLTDSLLYEYAESLLDYYFMTFRSELEKSLEASQVQRLERRWRELYPFAWADFQRFMLGWAPDHAKLNNYSAELSRQAMDVLTG